MRPDRPTRLPVPLHVHLLGGLHVTYNHATVGDLNGERLQSLLAYLLLHPETPHSRRQLAFLFWPDSSEDQARTNLRKLLFRLRRALPEADRFLHVEPQTIRWDPTSPHTLDVRELETLLQRSEENPLDRDILAAIAEAYPGDLLPACYDDWIVPLRQKLHQRVRHALSRLVTIHENRHAFAEAIVHAHHLLDLDPLDETSYRLLMRLYALNGDRAGALRLYDDCVGILQDKLGLEPDAETQQIYQHLLRGATLQPSPPPERSFSSDAIPLVGRKLEWQALQSAWQGVLHHKSRMVLLSGEAGIGKTRLAEELLHWAALQGVLVARTRAYAVQGAMAYAPITELLRSEAMHTQRARLNDLWLTQLARLLPELLEARPDLTPPELMRESWQLRRFLEAISRAVLGDGQPRLFLIDDLQWCDHETLVWLHHLLTTYPQARLLILGTRRVEEIEPDHPLNALCTDLQRSEQLVEMELSPLDLEDTTTLAAAVAGPSLDVAQVEHLYRETEGNPLFVVESLRARMNLKAAEDDPASASRSQARSATGLPPKIAALIQTRLAQLSPQAQDVLNPAATIGRSFTYDLLALVTQLDEDALVSGLDELWRRRIVRDQGANTYDFSHDKLREVAYSELSTARRTLLHRRIAEALQQAHDGDPNDISGQIADHCERAGLESQAAEFYMRAGERALLNYWHHQAARYFDRALACARSPAQAAHIRIGRARARFQLDDRAGALDDVAAGLTLLDPTQIQARGRAFYLQADIYFADAQAEPAETAVRAALALAEEIGDHETLCQCLSLLGQIQSQSGELAAEVGHIHCALSICRATGNRWRESRTLADLAFLQAQRGWFNEATTLAEQALAILETSYDRAGVAFATNILGRACGGMGAYDRAFAAFERCRQISLDIDLKSMAVQIPNMLGWLHQELGDYASALVLDRQGVALAQEWNKVNAEISARLNVCVDLYHLGDVEGALATLNRISIQMSEGDYGFHGWRWRLRLLHAQGHCHLALADYRRALELAEQGHALADTTSAAKYTALNHDLAGAARIGLREFESARRSLEQSIALADELPYPQLSWRARTKLAHLHHARGDRARARTDLAEAHRVVIALADSVTDGKLRATFLETEPVRVLVESAAR